MKPSLEDLGILFIAVIPLSKDGRSIKCPRCYHWHGVIDNFDNLCDTCQQIILSEFPNHESVPFIKHQRA